MNYERQEILQLRRRIEIQNPWFSAGTRVYAAPDRASRLLVYDTETTAIFGAETGGVDRADRK